MRYSVKAELEQIQQLKKINAALLAACKKTLELWDKHGLGDSEDESEPMYANLKAAVAKAEAYGQQKGDTT